jgi:hypothetical protein
MPGRCGATRWPFPHRCISIHHQSAREVRAPSDCVVCPAEGCHERILLAANSGGNAASGPERRASWQPRFLPDAERVGLQQSARAIHDGSDHVLRCCDLARGVFEWTAVSRTRPRGTVSATPIPRFSELYVRGFLNGGPNHGCLPKQYAIKMSYYFIEYHRAKLNTLASILSARVAGYAFSFLIFATESS